MNLTAYFYLLHIGSRVWAILRNEQIHYTKDSTIDFQDLRGADKMDPGNYKGGIGSLRAAEFGDEQICKDVPECLDTDSLLVEAPGSGAFRTKGLSATAQVVALTGRLMHHQDLALHGPDPVAMNGPILAEVKFPDVLVANDYSHDGKGLDHLLYPSGT